MTAVRWIEIRHVTFGEPRQAWCAGCQTSARAEIELVGLVESGVVPLGVWSCCDYCDGGVDAGVWRCAFCQAEMPMGTAAPIRHLVGAHPEPI